MFDTSLLNLKIDIQQQRKYSAIKFEIAKPIAGYIRISTVEE
jgi:hypothetical protein